MGLYLCYCGNEFVVQVSSINTEHTLSCGCYRKGKLQQRLTTHGLRNHKLYSIYAAIIQRVSNHNHLSFKNYGGRNIDACDEWKSDFKLFYDWATSNGYREGLSIDRIDNDGNYEPNNCRWVSRTIQNRNTRRIRCNNRSGYRGVGFYKPRDKWRARIRVDNNLIHLGYFNTSLEAGMAYDKYVFDNKLEHTTNNLNRS